MAQGPEAALLQYHQSGMAPQAVGQYDVVPQQQHLGHHHAQSIQFPVQAQYGPNDSPYLQQDMVYAQHVRVGSVPIQPAVEMPDDKRRKTSAVTATNDKELREMLVKNEGRGLREVAQEVIQKERTPMAEKTKQLFAMLWYSSSLGPILFVSNESSGYVKFANQQRPLSRETEYTHSMPPAVVLRESFL